MLAAVFLLPLISGLLILALPHTRLCRGLLIGTAVAHFIMILAVGVSNPAPALWGILHPDKLGIIFMTLSSLLFLAASFYGLNYLKEEEKEVLKSDFQGSESFSNAPERHFTACLCFFLAAVTLVTGTRNTGVLWVGIEMTTLSSAPLIYFHRHKRSLEATWKYLIICSTGIALALLGNILLSVAFHQPGAPLDSADYTHMAARAAMASKPWLKAAFIFLLVGYGVKMGLAPLHNWLPDAHSQAPSLVSALLSGALLNCAFLGILRGHQVTLAAGLGDFSGGLLMFFGLMSMVFAAFFIVGQGHFKRLLAYSSVEHMGILALAVGLGGSAVYGGMLHAVNHSLTKCMLFLLAGNIQTLYHTRSSYDAIGLRWTMPGTAALWAAGFLAIAGSPPFGIFISELTILKAMLTEGRAIVAAIYVTSLAVIFVGMFIPFMRMVQGPKPPSVKGKLDENIFNIGPSLVLVLATMLLGLYIPDWLNSSLRSAAALIGG